MNTHIGDKNNINGAKFNVISTAKSISDLPMSCLPTAFIVTTGYKDDHDNEVDLAISDAYGYSAPIMAYERNAITTLVKDLYDVDNYRDTMIDSTNTKFKVTKPIRFAGAKTYKDIPVYLSCILDSTDESSTSKGTLKDYFTYLENAIWNSVSVNSSQSSGSTEQQSSTK